MKNLRRFGNIIFACTLSLIAVVATYVLAVGTDTPNIQLIQREALKIEHNWYYYDQYGMRKPVPHLPDTIPATGTTSRLYIDVHDLPRLAPGEEHDRFLCFFSNHQDVLVRLDNRTIYRSETRPTPRWIDSYRGMYHLVPLPPDIFLSRTLCIETTAHTKRGTGRYSIVQIGERAHLLQSIMHVRYEQGLLGLGLLVSALFLFGTSYVFHSFVRKDFSMLFLALFAIAAGLWQLEDSRILQFFSGYQPLHWVLEYLMPPVIPILTYLFLRHIDRATKSRALAILGICTIIIPLLQLALQITKISTLSDCMFMSHILFFYDCVYILHFLGRQKRSPLQILLIVCYSCSLAIFLFMFVSLFFFGMFFDGIMSIGLLLTFAAMTLMTHNRVLQRAQEASKNAVYKELAFTDIATGVLNKTAWYTLIDNFIPKAPEAEKFTLVLFDMNNLKKTNDTYGHLVGDQMIKSFAEAVKTAFTGTGKVYRIGGDEFIAVCKNAPHETIASALRKFDEAVTNQPASEHPFSAAYGVTFFTPGSRTDFETAITAADNQMYENKVAMKQARTE